MWPRTELPSYALPFLAILWFGACRDADPAQPDLGGPDSGAPIDATSDPDLGAPDAGGELDAEFGSDVGPEPDSGVPNDAEIDSGIADAGSPPDDEILVFTDLLIPGHPHAIDLFVPPGAERVIVYLHGGGGTKETAASRESGVRLDDPARPRPVLDEAWMLANRTAWAFPQGQHLPGARLAKTWDNYMMLSGADDVAFLNALAAALRGGTLQASVPAFARIYLAGHSNGGLMANRLWCEATTSYDGYGGVAGPPSTDLLPGGPHPCAPSAIRPFIGVIGSEDTVLQTANNWDGDWAVNSCLQTAAGATMPNPNVANEEQFHRNFRVPHVCSSTAAPPVVTPQATTWSDCNGQVQLIRVEGADHCVTPTTSDLCIGGGQGGGCANALDVQLGTRIRDVLVEFFSSTEP